VISRRAVRAFAGAAALAVLLASCGGGGGGSDVGYKEPKGPSIATITIHAGNFYFKPSQIDASAGINTIELTGDGGLHTLVFDNGKVPGFQLEVAGSGDTADKKVDLEPGKYVFYCDIPTHRQQGMEGTITVK
jgi:plastocyanin